MHVLISAGPTIEDIDPVRFISNRASGKLGVEFARAALKSGHTVTLVHGPLPEHVQRDVAKLGKSTIAPVRSAEQMRVAMVKHLPKADVVIMNASVADFAPVTHSDEKLKKAVSGLTLKLKSTPDILKELGRKRKKNQILIGFALETGSGSSAKARATSRLAEAKRKLKDKNADVIVLNTPETMGADKGKFILIDHHEAHETGEMTKKQFAELLIALVTPCHEHSGGCGCEH